MNPKRKKLVWEAVAAFVVAIGFFLFTRYKESGAVSWADWRAIVIAAAIAAASIGTVAGLFALLKRSGKVRVEGGRK